MTAQPRVRTEGKPPRDGSAPCGDEGQAAFSPSSSEYPRSLGPVLAPQVLSRLPDRKWLCRVQPGLGAGEGSEGRPWGGGTKPRALSLHAVGPCGSLETCSWYPVILACFASRLWLPRLRQG